MNRSLSLFCLLLCCTGLWLAACNSHGNKKGSEKDSILHRPPFVPLTDSLQNNKGADAAGLYLRRAELLSRNNLHELAAEDYKIAWNLKPDELTGFRYASTLGIIGQTDQAARLLLDCLQRFPGNPSFPDLLGDLYQQAGKTKEALSVYNSVLSKDSLSFETWYEKGLLLEKVTDTAGAITALEKAYGLQPVNTYGLELAHLYAEKRNPAALTICDDILRRDSSHELLDPLFIKGIFYSNSALYKKAIIQFDSCIRRDWKFTDAYLEKGIVLFHQKQYDTAMSTFQMTVRVSNTYADGYYWIGRCYEAAGHKDQAILYYRQALGLDKDFAEAADRIKQLQ